jgi:uncharacterized protein with HEPN domain
MSKRAPELLLNDILQCAENIFEYTEGQTYSKFIDDRKTVDAVVRNMEIIGEASNRLPDEYKTQMSAIDWHKIRGRRNRIVHHYSGIDEQIIWSVKEDYLPQLVAQIINYLNIQ